MSPRSTTSNKQQLTRTTSSSIKLTSKRFQTCCCRCHISQMPCKHGFKCKQSAKKALPREGQGREQSLACTLASHRNQARVPEGESEWRSGHAEVAATKQLREQAAIKDCRVQACQQDRHAKSIFESIVQWQWEEWDSATEYESLEVQEGCRLIIEGSEQVAHEISAGKCWSGNEERCESVVFREGT